MTTPTSRSRLELPERSDLLSLDEVENLIGEADREVSELEREAAAATAAADAMDRRVIEEGADERSSSWAMMQLRRFLDELSDDVDREVAALVDVAERWSRQRVDEARQQAEAIRAGERKQQAADVPEAVPGDRPSSVLPDASQFLVMGSSTPNGAHDDPVAPEDDEEAFFAPRQSVIAPTPRRQDEGAPLPPFEPDRGWDPPEAETSVVDPDLRDTPDAPTEALTPPAPANSEARDANFWTEAEPEKRRGRLRNLPWSAILQVLAVIAIAVFILLRLS